MFVKPTFDGTPTVVLSVDYDEYKPDSYRGITIYEDDGQREERLYTASQVEAFVDKFPGRVLYSSSFDNFVADGGVFPSEPN